MSLTIVFLLLGAAALGGGVIGFIFRWLLVLARKGSIEIQVQKVMLDARERAEKITAEAESVAKEKLAGADAVVAEKEEKVTAREERIFKREEQLDKKQSELEREIETAKAKIEEVKTIKDKADALLGQRADELSKVAGLTKTEALEQLHKEIAREADEDLMMRAAKLEREGLEKLERRAKDILVTSIHR